MALTHQLDRRGTPVREFFELYFPAKAFRALRPAWLERVRTHPLRCPAPEGVNLGTIGTAFDYRARLCWEPLDWRKTVAAAGMRRLYALGREELVNVGGALGAELARLAPERCLVVDDELEQRICSCCYALALYEQFFRTHVAATSSPLMGLGPRADVGDVLALAPKAATNDLAGMARLLCESQPDLVASPAILNPTFDGSFDIGGADADILVDDLLLEIKTTTNDAFERVDHLYQLLGYALLDYSSEYAISRVGVYLARRGVLVEWTIDDVLGTCCTTSDWPSVQVAFREAVRQVE
jgi:hypothetical protein